MSAVAGRRYRLGFVVEQTLGHRTHYRNLRRYIGEDDAVLPTWMPIEFTGSGLSYRLPGMRGNWSARASWLASHAVRQARRRGALDVVFYHTQVASLLSPLDARQAAVVSLDATPINFDTVGRYYGHSRGGRLERLKFAANRWSFARARALVTWCHWAKVSLVEDYGVPADKVAVVAPGVDLEQWPRIMPEARSPEEREGRLRLLFVGGDFARKGGEILLECFEHYFSASCELWLVTQTPVGPRPHVHVFNGLTPNSEELLRLYAEADVFVFPTLSDCAPLAVPEAMAASLPVVSTAVGAIPEMVRDDETGYLVEPGSVEALRGALERLLPDAALRASLGERGRRLVEAEHDARKNARRLLALLKAVADGATGPEAVAASAAAVGAAGAAGAEKHALARWADESQPAAANLNMAATLPDR
jgi:glycosyltransferase involved in cell wall biosynthesis